MFRIEKRGGNATFFHCAEGRCDIDVPRKKAAPDAFAASLFFLGLMGWEVLLAMTIGKILLAYHKP